MTETTQHPTILVVDDAAPNIAILAGILKQHYKIKVAKEGGRALKIAGLTPPDLILLDVMMPEMDGYEVCRRLKADAKTRDIPVVFVTGMSDGEDQKKGLELGAAGYLTKPVEPDKVLSMVRGLVDKD